MDRTPRTLLRSIPGDVPKEASLSPLDRGHDPRAVIKGFLRPQHDERDQYKELLCSPVFEGFDPQIDGQVFRLTRYAAASPRKVVQVPTTPTKSGQSDRRASAPRPAAPAPAPVPVPSSSQALKEDPVSAMPVQALPSRASRTCYSAFDKLLVAINLGIFLGILATCCVFLRVLMDVHSLDILRFLGGVNE